VIDTALDPKRRPGAAALPTSQVIGRAENVRPGDTNVQVVMRVVELP
jgi:hypothetical protein